MLALTPEIESALRWFDATHELVAFGTAVRYRLVRLPGPGSLGEQDARLMEALVLLCETHNAILAAPSKEPSDG